MSCGHKHLEALLAFAAQLKLQIPPDPRSRPLAGTTQPCAASHPAVCVRAVLRAVSALPPDKGGSLGHRQGSHGHCARCWWWGTVSQGLHWGTPPPVQLQDLHYLLLCGMLPRMQTVAVFLLCHFTSLPITPAVFFPVYSREVACSSQGNCPEQALSRLHIRGLVCVPE